MSLKPLSLAALLLLGGCGPGEVRKESRPNFVFILADDLGYGDLGCYGQELIETPRIDRLAENGVRFTQFYAGSTVCAPSRNVLMTGEHTGRALVRGNARINLRPEDRTVAEVLREAGYRTALIGKWGLGQEGSSGVPTRQGFGYFFGYLDQRHAHNYYPTFLIRNEERVSLPNVVPDEDEVGAGEASERLVYSHDLFVEEALAFIEEQREVPFFLYLALTLPHANNEAGDRGMEVPDLGMYADRDWPEPQKGLAAMISRMDRDVGRVVDKLEELGISERTILFFSSDNGPHNEGGNDSTFFDSNGPLRGLKRDLYEGGIRVPMIAAGPGQIPAGRTSDHVAYLGDMMATLTELAGVTHPDGLDSLSFVPALTGRGEQPEHEYLYWEFYERGTAQAVRRGNWKAVRKPMIHGEIELYDLAQDPGEEEDVASIHPTVAEEVRRLMDEAHVPSPHWTVPVPDGR